MEIKTIKNKEYYKQFDEITRERMEMLTHYRVQAERTKWLYEHTRGSRKLSYKLINWLAKAMNAWYCDHGFKLAEEHLGWLLYEMKDLKDTYDL